MGAVVREWWVVRFLFSGLVALLGLCVLSSCAIAPAGLERREVFGGTGGSYEREDLGVLLMEALADPESAEGAHALGHFVETWKRERENAQAGIVTVTGADGKVTKRYEVRFVSDHAPGYTLDYFDEISPAVDYEVKKISHHRRAGYGAPLVALRENRGQEAIEAYFPPEAITRPLTAVVETTPTAGDRPQQVEIRLLCPLRHDTVSHHGKQVPVAADFSVPWAGLLSRTGELNRQKLTDAFNRNPEREPNLYLLEPYDPTKEPLIMVHGLFSTPLTWANLSNELWADDEIRNRYQIWHYLYNTSAPALYSGRILQQQLKELRQILDPSGTDPAMQRTTIIAHSMGGIVSRRMITRPKNVFWDAAFTQSFESLKLSEEDRAALQEAFFWEPEGHIKRMIYVAVPHRGSDYADNFFGQLGRVLVKPPDRFSAFYERISAANPGAFTEAYAALGRGELDSVGALSPKQPTLQILAELPNSHSVVEHSVIGDRGRGGALEESSDGIVPYWSSHLERARSERIVASGHSAVDDEGTVLEVKRVLKL
ncbi:MAG: hypothetical protein AAF591_07325 [Verrucomicrobiota bacterium]